MLAVKLLRPVEYGSSDADRHGDAPASAKAELAPLAALQARNAGASDAR
jgi:hypothetical protein